eukprot:TRINITY_DN1127_c1_g1_i1.p1 TRINITY_DN1127_c1_g1~~TRINITY_DN1127_c1_g1_i1.p1  ORF type:complete len:778 (+),score=210.71 TRINITY_DN1127_c1_g1_i1:80-2335(+)
MAMRPSSGKAIPPPKAPRPGSASGGSDQSTPTVQVVGKRPPRPASAVGEEMKPIDGSPVALSLSAAQSNALLRPEMQARRASVGSPLSQSSAMDGSGEINAPASPASSPKPKVTLLNRTNLSAKAPPPAATALPDNLNTTIPSPSASSPSKIPSTSAARVPNSPGPAQRSPSPSPLGRPSSPSPVLVASSKGVPNSSNSSTAAAAAASSSSPSPSSGGPILVSSTNAKLRPGSGSALSSVSATLSTTPTRLSNSSPLTSSPIADTTLATDESPSQSSLPNDEIMSIAVQQTMATSSKKTISVKNAHAPDSNEPRRFVDFVGQDLANSLSKDERERQEVIFEMIKTEKSYITDLKMIVSMFLNPIKDKEILNKQQIAGLFSNVEAIINVNEKLLAEFLRRQKENPVIEKIGDVFANNGDMLKLYAVYCSNQPLIAPTIQSLSKQNANFAKFLNDCQSKPECRNLLITDFLIQPLQRVCKYPLLLRSVLKATPPEHPDHQNLIAGLEVVEKVVNQVNARVKQVENVMKLKEIQAKLVFPKDKSFDLVAHDRSVSKEGPTKIIRPPEKKGGKEIVKDFYIFLLSDFLLISTPIVAKKSKETPVQLYQFERVVPLYEPNTDHIIEVLAVNAASMELLELQRDKEGVPLKIRFDFLTASERDNWITEIETITYRYADNWNRNVKRFSMFTRESTETAPRPRPMPKKSAPPATVPALEKRVAELENELTQLKKQFDEERQYYIKQIQELNEQLKAKS